MVKKLFKHEFLALFRLLLPIEGIVLGLGILTRIILLFETDSVIFEIVFRSAIFTLVVGLFGGPVAAMVLAVIRFYKNLFGKEGYLTLVLPVSNPQHILVKAAAATISVFMAIAISFLSLSIAASGELFVELVKAANYLIRYVLGVVSGWHLFGYFVEIIILSILTEFVNFLLIYACISIGQLAKKNRVFWAIGVYYLYYTVLQVLLTVGSVLSVLFINEDVWIRIFNFLEKNILSALHIGFGIGIVWMVIIGFVYFAISNFIMTKKINLE